MSGRPAPPKPWERRGATPTSTTTPLGPSTANDGAPKPWETSTTTTSAPAATAAGTASNSIVPSRARPWEQPSTSYGGNTYGGSTYGSTYGGALGNTSGYGGYNTYGSSTLGSTYGGLGGGLGSTYGGGGFGSSYGGYGNSYGGGGMYGRPYGSTYGGGYGSGLGGVGGGMYGTGSMYGSPYGGSAYGGSLMGGQYGRPPGAPFDPANPPPAPPTTWQAMLHAIGGIVHFFGRLSFLVDENAHAVHFFIAALLQLLDRAGSLYGELARFVLRLLGYKGKPKEQPSGPLNPAGPLPGSQAPGFAGPPMQPALPAPEWDNVWGT